MSDNGGPRHRVVSAGRPDAPEFACASNSYCLPCAQWYFGHRYAKCPRCKGDIFRCVPDEDLRLFQSRTSLSTL